jgi:hypothetical protein
VLLDHGLGRMRRPQHEEVQVWCRHRLSIVDLRVYPSALLVACIECFIDCKAEMASVLLHRQRRLCNCRVLEIVRLLPHG